MYVVWELLSGFFQINTLDGLIVPNKFYFFSNNVGNDEKRWAETS